MAIAYSSFKSKVKKMLMGNGFEHQGWAVDDYDPETDIHDYSGGPPWIPLQRDTPPATEKETARFLAEVISKHLLSKIKDPKLNVPLVPLVYRTPLDTMGGITEDLADDIEAGLLELKSVTLESMINAKLKVAFIPMGTSIVTWMATNTVFTFLSPHATNFPVVISNTLTTFGNPATLGRDFGLALKQEGATQDIITTKVVSALVKTFEDYFAKVGGAFVASNGTSAITTTWSGLV
jgi:hypothetical protein